MRYINKLFVEISVRMAHGQFFGHKVPCRKSSSTISKPLPSISRLTLHLIMALAALLILASCGGGDSGGNDGSGNNYNPPVANPYIYAEVTSFSVGSAPPNFKSASVYVLDDSTGNSISNATVTINTIPLIYNAAKQEYQGNPTLDQGATVNLVVSVNGRTYTASGRQFTSYPSISLPSSGTTWQASFANTVAWTAGASAANAFYGLGVLDADSGEQLVWPSDGFLQELQVGTNTYSIPADCISIGKRLVVVGIANSLTIPDAAAGSEIVISGFNSVPITVIDGSGAHWTRRAQWSTTADFQGVIWADTQFVAIAHSGGIFTSPDGVTWTHQTSGATNFLEGVAWNGNQFVVVGLEGTVLTSPDGVTWTPHNVGRTLNLNDIVWSGNHFVATGYSHNSGGDLIGHIFTSNDGVNWTITSTVKDVLLNQVSWSGSQFVAVGFLYGYGAPDTGLILTSPDGVTWTSRNAGGANRLYGVTWSGTQYVIVGSGGTILSSTDGITWTVSTSGNTDELYSVAWSGLYFVAVQTNQTILRSPDGITWTTISPESIFTGHTLNDITWSGTQFLAVGDGGTIFSSP